RTRTSSSPSLPARKIFCRSTAAWAGQPKRTSLSTSQGLGAARRGTEAGSVSDHDREAESPQLGVEPGPSPPVLAPAAERRRGRGRAQAGRPPLAYDLDASGAAQLSLEVLVELLTVWSGDDQVPLAGGYGRPIGAGHCPLLRATPPRGIGREQGRRRQCGAKA